MATTVFVVLGTRRHPGMDDTKCLFTFGIVGESTDCTAENFGNLVFSSYLYISSECVLLIPNSSFR